MSTSLDFRFSGTIRVESTFPGFTAKTLTAAGGTGEDGQARPVVWSYVTAGKVYYVADRPGAYGLAEAEADFPDVAEGFWGREAIAFVSARGLFQGVGDGRFAPADNASRAEVAALYMRLIQRLLAD